MNKRAIVIVLDSFGIGALPDAVDFGDVGADTLGHIDEYCYKNNNKFDIPNLLKLGLGRAYNLANNKTLYCDKDNYQLNGSYGAAQELSSGKDTTSGHWEIAGHPVLFDWGYFSSIENSFPEELLAKIVERASLPGYLGNCHASGTDIINRLAEEHVATAKPIFYTSADSVFQVACHEKYFGLDKLYSLCEIIRQELVPYNIARVIARPFIGEDATTFSRTGNRHDYSLKPNDKTLLDICSADGGQVIAIGKIADIYANMGVSVTIKANGLEELCAATINAIEKYRDDKTFIMTNLVDFDMLYGHRRNVLGYKEALEKFDEILPQIINKLEAHDILILTADHGCDPTWPGSDHTREYIPILSYNNGIVKNLGIRKTFADIGQSVAKHLSITKLSTGLSYL